LITQLQEDLIHERGVSAQLREDLRTARSHAAQPIFDEMVPMPEEDFAKLSPLTRRTRTPSMMRARALEILAERRREKEKTS